VVFASLLAVGISTLIQVRRIGPVGAGALLPMFTAAVSIPFCITAVVDGGPGTLLSLVVVTGVLQIIISKWVVILRRIVTPVVSGIVIMILSVTLASVVFALLDGAAQEEPMAAPLTAMITLAMVAALSLRHSAVLRLWGPVIGIVVGCIAAAGFGIFDLSLVKEAPWVGIPTEVPDLAPSFGVHFWVLLPSFLFLAIIFSIHANGETIAQQRVAWRDNRAVDFRQVQGGMAAGGVSNMLAGIGGAVPNIINSGIISFSQTTGIAARRVGYCIAFIFIAAAFLPKVSGLIASIPAPVMTGYLMMVTGTLLVDGTRLVIQNEQNRQKVVVAGICFWIGASFHFNLFYLPSFGPVWDSLFKSAITTGGLAAVVMILYLEFTNPRRMRFQSSLHVDSLPDLNKFMTRFATNRGWNDAMKERLSAVAEETLLTLAPLDLTLDLLDSDDPGEDRTLIVLAASDGSVADLEFIGGGKEANLEDRIRQLQQHDTQDPVEEELSLRLLRSFAQSVRHQQYHGTDIITVRVGQPGG
jgi:NCS2 family nucleobase:cation symporter-2/xanthine permease XanP